MSHFVEWNIDTKINTWQPTYKKDQINENAPIKIVAYDLESKYFILKSARKLREYNLRNKTKIVISQDMSEVDRQVNRKLIEKRNELNSKLNDQETFYYGIRNNKVVLINKNKRTWIYNRKYNGITNLNNELNSNFELSIISFNVNWA